MQLAIERHDCPNGLENALGPTQDLLILIPCTTYYVIRTVTPRNIYTNHSHVCLIYAHSSILMNYKRHVRVPNKNRAGGGSPRNQGTKATHKRHPLRKRADRYVKWTISTYKSRNYFRYNSDFHRNAFVFTVDHPICELSKHSHSQPKGCLPTFAKRWQMMIMSSQIWHNVWTIPSQKHTPWIQMRRVGELMDPHSGWFLQKVLRARRSTPKTGHLPWPPMSATFQRCRVYNGPAAYLFPQTLGRQVISSCSSDHCSASTCQQCPYRKRVGMQLGFCRILPCGSLSCAYQTGNMACCSAGFSQRVCHLRRPPDHQDRADEGGASDALHLHSHSLTEGWRGHHLPLPLHHRC